VISTTSTCKITKNLETTLHFYFIHVEQGGMFKVFCGEEELTGVGIIRFFRSQQSQYDKLKEEDDKKYDQARKSIDAIKALLEKHPDFVKDNQEVKEWIAKIKD